MKKILFCASLLALATSCTQDETLSLNTPDEVRGIAFEVAEQLDARIQYDKDGDAWAPMWYAETDRIAVWSNGTVHGKTTNAGGAWNALSSTYATYKATQSTKKANFTAIDDTNLLTFQANNKKGAKFYVVYPNVTGMTLSVDQAKTKSENDSLIINGALENLATQTIESAKGQNKAIVQLAHAEATQKQVYESVGEKMTLTFNFATPVLKFGTSGLTEAYQKAFGKLTEITVENKGYTDAKDAKKSIAATPLTYKSGATINVDTINWGHVIFGEGDAAKITVTIGQNWNDNALAPIAVAEADRAAYRKGAVKEAVETMFSFDNIDLTVKKEIDVDFVAGSSFKAITLNMANYPYLVTKKGANPGRTLFVNSGDFSDILTEKADSIDWTDTETAEAKATAVAFSEITTVVVAEGVVLDADDFKVLNKMTKVTSLTLNGNTSIPTKSLKGLTTLTEINLPKVTTVGAEAFAADLAKVNMPAYAFGEGVNDMLLKASCLVELNMGATSMNAGFPANGLLLTDFKKLTKVTVKDGIKIGANAFKGCEALKTVSGVVDIAGTYAFDGCKVLESIIIKNKDIKDGAFNGCAKLAKVYYENNKTALVPNAVGKEAFANTLVALDLSATTTIGDNAFLNNIKLVGSAYTGSVQKVVTVGATTIGASAFEGCTGFQFIYFANATSIGNNFLADTDNLKEVKFAKAFTYTGETAAAKTTFGNSTEIKLFINEAQTGVVGNVLTLTAQDKDKTETPIEFDQITEE